MIHSQHLDANPGSESYFYGSHLSSGCVPRFIVTLKMTIDGEKLVAAMGDIKPRFPQMAVKIRRTADNKNYELEDNNLPFPVFHDKGDVVRTMGTEETNWHLLTVTYFEKTLMFDFHHLLGDGTGFIIFIRAVLYHYLELLGVPIDNDGTILTVDQKYNDKESEDPYKYIEGQEAKLPDWYRTDIEAFNIPDISTDDDPADTVVQIRIPFDKLRGVFKKYQSSPVTFLGPLFSHSIFEKYQEIIGNKYIVASVPVNLRPYYPTETLRYFITVAALAHSKLFLQEDFENLLKTQKTLLDMQTTPETLNYKAQVHIAGMKKFREMDMSVEQKAELMDNKVRTSMKKYTYVITNMGKISLPETMSQYITEFYPILPTATCPFTIATTTWKNELMLSITQRTEDSDVCERFVDLLNRLEIPAYISDKFKFHTMRCKPL